MITYSITEQNVVVWLNGEALVATKSNPNWNNIIQKIHANDSNGLKEMFDLGKAINNVLEEINIKFNGTSVEIINNILHIDGEPAHGSLAKRIVEFYTNGHPVEPLVKFIDLLWRNPVPRVRGQLFEYLQRYKLPICDDGWFLGFKALNPNLTSKWDNQTLHELNKPMVPIEAETDPRIACDKGYHVGNWEYVKNYGTHSSVFAVIRVNPMDVRSCPTDEAWQKLRCRTYTPVAIIPREDVREPDTNYGHASHLAPHVESMKIAYGTKPNGHRHWNVRDQGGRFTKKI